MHYKKEMKMMNFLKICCCLYFILWSEQGHSFAQEKLPDQCYNSKIKIICTTALIDFNYAMRKEEYISSILILKNYGYEPYIIEACHPSPPSFFENYSQNVIYTNVNDYHLVNKGVNEARSIIEGFKHFMFDENDMIIKLTGRYRLNSPYFLKIVEDNPEVDAFIKFDPGFPIPHGRAITGCFCIRYKYFNDMLSRLDFVKMEQELIDIEIEVANYIHKMEQQGCKVMYIDKIDMTSNIGGPWPPVETQW